MRTSKEFLFLCVVALFGRAAAMNHQMLVRHMPLDQNGAPLTLDEFGFPTYPALTEAERLQQEEQLRQLHVPYEGRQIVGQNLLGRLQDMLETLGTVYRGVCDALERLTQDLEFPL